MPARTKANGTGKGGLHGGDCCQCMGQGCGQICIDGTPEKIRHISRTYSNSVIAIAIIAS